jgi:diacylglycerol kinase family enzyme
MLITNPFATSTTSEARDAVARALASRVDVDVVPTTHRGHAAELGAQAAGQGYDAVVVHGGDGSVNEVVNGMLGTPGESVTDPATLPAVGVVPGGNANVFARALGVRRGTDRAIDQLVDGLVTGRRRTIGLGHMLDRWFLFNAGMGIDATVVRGVDEKRGGGRKVTNLMYVQTAVASFLKPGATDPEITVEMPDRDRVTGGAVRVRQQHRAVDLSGNPCDQDESGDGFRARAGGVRRDIDGDCPEPGARREAARGVPRSAGEKPAARR